MSSINWINLPLPDKLSLIRSLQLLRANADRWWLKKRSKKSDGSPARAARPKKPTIEFKDPKAAELFASFDQKQLSKWLKGK